MSTLMILVKDYDINTGGIHQSVEVEMDILLGLLLLTFMPLSGFHNYDTSLCLIICFLFTNPTLCFAISAITICE